MLELLVLVEWVAHLMMKSPKAVRSSYLNCHGPTYHVAQNIELVAGSDPYQEQADLFAERWGIDHSHIYNDHREMLEKKFLDGKFPWNGQLKMLTSKIKKEIR